MRLVIIGGVAAGTKAAARARRVDPALEIVLYQDEGEVSYTGCGQPYYLSGLIARRESLVIRTAADFQKDGILVKLRHRAEALDLAGQTIRVRGLDADKADTVPFDRLIIATGARPVTPQVSGIGLKGVVSLRSMAELDRFKESLDTLQPRNAVIVGGGYIGLEVAESLRALGLDVTVLERCGRLFPRLDVDMSQLIYDCLSTNGVPVVLDDGLTEIVGKEGRATFVLTETGRCLPADVVVLAIGIRPNVELALQAGITLGPTGAIAVDGRMETNVQGVFAAGDCAESRHRLTGTPVWGPLGDIANLHGRVAGENAAGGDARFPGILGTAIFKTFELNVGITGLAEDAARTAGLDPVSVTISAKDKARYYPGGRDVSLKLVADANSGRLLGAQAVGAGAVDKLIDIAATALLGKLDCRDLEYADFAYAPPFSPVLSPVILAANALAKKIREKPLANLAS